MQIQAVGNRIGYAGKLLQANWGWFSAVYRNAILFFGIVGIGFLYIASSKFAIGPFQNIVVPSGLVILGSLMMVGRRALTITSFDYFFLGFILLSITSHIFANEFLFRELGQAYLTANVYYILTMALLFRAFFCLIYVAPKLGSQMFMGSAMLFLGGLTLIGIMQRFGPGKTFATKIAATLTINSLQVVQMAQTDRPSAVFTNPNIFGYAICAFTAFVLGWGLSGIERIKPWKTAAVVIMLGAGLLGTIACQSRQSMGVLILAPMVFAIAVRLKARDGFNFIVLGILFAIAGVGLTFAVSSAKSDYLLSISKSGVQHDQSYMARSEELRKLLEVSPEIALGGAGQSMSNINPMIMYSDRSKYNTYEIDSEWGNIFEAFGIWGPLLLAMFYLFTGLDSRLIWLIDNPEARMIAWTSAIMLGFNLLLTAAAVRVAKYESAGFTYEILGVLSAWKVYGVEKGLIRYKPKKSKATPA